MKIQRTDWGYIEWRHIHDENDKKQLMDIRISVVLPGKSQPKHRGTNVIRYVWGRDSYYKWEKAS